MKSTYEPLISIAIASYNYAQYLERGFRAIQDQGFTDYEIVYCDDGSTDDSVKLIQGFIEENPDMDITLLVNESNQGLKKTKSKLIRHCRGMYIMLCDADDWMEKDCLYTLAGIAQYGFLDRIISEVKDINEKGKVLQIQDIPLHPSKWLWNIHHGCLYKRSILIDNHIEIEGEPDDVYLTAMVNQFTKNICWIRKPLYNWYVHKDSEGRRVHKGKPIESIVEEFNRTIRYLDQVTVLSEEKEYVELLLIKVYYLNLYHSINGYSLREKMWCYDRLRDLLRKFHPAYLKNALIKSGKTYSPVREYARKIIRLSCRLEKWNMMKPALFGYHFVSRLIYFDQ